MREVSLCQVIKVVIHTFLVLFRQLYFSRGYSRTPPANKAEIEQRVLKVCKAFDKITAENVSLRRFKIYCVEKGQNYVKI